MIGTSESELVKELFETYRQMMYKIAFEILHNKADAEDAVQSAFLSIINNIDKISKIPCDERGFYFVNVIEHTSINILNRQRRYRADDINIYEDIASDDSVEEKADENILTEEIEKALYELSDRDYSLMYLYIFKQMKPREIAKELDISEKNIRVYIKKARERLIKILKRKGYDYDI